MIQTFNLSEKKRKLNVGIQNESGKIEYEEDASYSFIHAWEDQTLVNCSNRKISQYMREQIGLDPISNNDRKELRAQFKG